jgi:hypothetical protein
MSRRRWFVPLAVAAGLGVVLLALATTSRYVARSHLPPSKATAFAFEHSHVRSWGTLSDDATVSERETLVSVNVRIKPSPVLEDSDAEVQIELQTNVEKKYGYVLRAKATMRLESDSFGIVPSGVRILNLERGSAGARYAISPKGHGEKKLRVYVPSV